MNRRIPILSLLVAMTMVMAACGPNTDEADESEAAPESEPAASAPNRSSGGSTLPRRMRLEQVRAPARGAVASPLVQ